jgi:hypothetical protein
MRTLSYLKYRLNFLAVCWASLHPLISHVWWHPKCAAECATECILRRPPWRVLRHIWRVRTHVRALARVLRPHTPFTMRRCGTDRSHSIQQFLITQSCCANHDSVGHWWWPISSKGVLRSTNHQPWNRTRTAAAARWAHGAANPPRVLWLLPTLKLSAAIAR